MQVCCDEVIFNGSDNFESGVPAGCSKLYLVRGCNAVLMLDGEKYDLSSPFAVLVPSGISFSANIFDRSDSMLSCSAIIPVSSLPMFAQSLTPDTYVSFVKMMKRLSSLCNAGKGNAGIPALSNCVSLVTGKSIRLAAGSSAGSAAAKALLFIKENAFSGITPEDVYAFAGAKGDETEAAVKKATGKSVADYIEAFRIFNCCNALSQTGLSIRDIAVCAGYKTEKEFRSLLILHTGMDAEEFRESEKKRLDDIARYRAEKKAAAEKKNS